MAAWTLAPVCFGVGVVSWFDTTTPAKGDDGGGEGFTTTTTTPLGVAFAMMGVVASSLYTVWIQWYHEKLECSSMQLLMNQAPISVLVMLYVIPVADDVTVWREVGWGVYGLIGIVSFLSLFFCLVLEFFIFIFIFIFTFFLHVHFFFFLWGETNKVHITDEKRYLFFIKKEWITGLSDQSFAIRDYSRSWSCE